MWEISFTNLNMLLATIPVYDEEEKKKEKEAGSEETTLEDIFKDEM